MRFLQLWKLTLALLLGALLIVGVACGDDDDDDVADDISGDSASSASPTAVAGVDEDVQEVEVTIEDGEFSEDEVEFQMESPSVLQVTNNDDVRYVLTIGDLVAEGWPIAPNQATAVEFTAPVDDEYEAQLTTDEGGDPLDTMRVVVVAAGNTDD